MMMMRIILFALVAAAAGLAQTVNCLVAVVNGEIITLLDVQVATEFGLGHPGAVGEGTDPRLAALDALIDRKVVLALAREPRGVEAEELATAVDSLRRALGEVAFAAKLAKFGFEAKDLEPYLEDRILYDRALGLRFGQTIPVTLTEIERHYRDIYAPEQARLGLAAEPIERVAGLIESKLRDERRAQQMKDWVRDMRKGADIELKKDCLR